MAFLFPLFFTSGIPALLYQVVWQRSLFTIYGTNTESATAVVAAFLLGLGLGAHIGGWLAGRWPRHLLPIYAAIELVIGLFGLVSLSLFDAVGTWSGAGGMAQTGLIAFVLVVLPTVLMGATLPVLAAYLVAHKGHVGKGVGALYFVNTLGSAFACFLAAEVLMDALGQHGTIRMAVGLNLVVAIGALMLSRLPATASLPAVTAPSPAKAAGFRLTPDRAALLTGISGFLSLSFEMLWFRAYAFLSGGSAKDFAYLLGFFLAGIAGGGLAGRKLSQLADRSLDWGRAVPTVLFAVAGICALVCAPIMGWIPPDAAPAWALPAVTLVAGLWAALFPVIAHLSVSPDAKAGAGIGRLYLANVIGSVAGCLLTGFVLMDYVGTGSLSTILAIVGVLAAWMLWIDAAPRLRLTWGVGLCGVSLLLFLAAAPLYAKLYEQLLYRSAAIGGMAFAHLVETKSGIVAVAGDGIIYGGGVYDGRMQIDFAHDENGIFRPLSLSAFHPAPKRVLMIGLSGGAWAQVIANHPQVEELVVIEINPGYLSLIPRYPMVASLTVNPKVKIVIDDGRRWVRNHKDEKFDVVVMNTTFHWRSSASNVLSQEFLTQVGGVLNPGGVVMFNATGSREVHRTAASAFPYAMRFTNMMVGSLSPIAIDAARWQDSLSDYAIDGKFLVGEDEASRDAVRHNVLRLATLDADPRLSEWDTMESRDHILADTAGLRTISDDNMGLEWRDHER